MEIVQFDKTWQEIPEQDNPAMDYSAGVTGHKHRHSESIMIFRGAYPRITDGGIVVAHVPIEGDITKKGVFWTLENAQLFAKSLAL